MVACEIEVGCFLGETLGAFGFQGLFLFVMFFGIVDKLEGAEIWLIIILLVILRRHIISYEIIYAVFCGQLLDRRLDVSGRGYLPE